MFERGIQRECVHEWVRPLFQKIWPEPRTSWKRLCNSGLTNRMLSLERKLRSAPVCVCIPKIHEIFKFYTSVLLHVLHSTSYSLTMLTLLTVSAPREHARRAWALPVTCLQHYRAISKLKVAWFPLAEQITLYHVAPVLAPDRQADMRSRDGAIKENHDC